MSTAFVQSSGSKAIRAMNNVLALLAMASLLASCAGSNKSATAGVPLMAPVGVPTAAAMAVDRGNHLFAQGQWELAYAQYAAAITIRPELAEAHYDLALTLDRLGRNREAIAHYKEAANLAPGHTVIWNSPPLRQHGIDVRESLVDKMRPHPDPQRPY